MAFYVNQNDNFPIRVGEDVLTGQLLAVSPMDGLAYLACAAGGTEEVPALGVAETNVSEGGWVECKHWGGVEQSALVLEPGDILYLSNTPGAISKTAGATSQIVGFALTPTQWKIHIHLVDSHSHVSSSSSSYSSSSSSQSSSSGSSSSGSLSSSSSSTSSCSSSSASA